MGYNCNSVNNGARDMKFGSYDGGEDGEYTDIGSVEISQILVMQEAFFLRREPFINVECMVFCESDRSSLS